MAQTIRWQAVQHLVTALNGVFGAPDVIHAFEVSQSKGERDWLCTWRVRDGVTEDAQRTTGDEPVNIDINIIYLGEPEEAPELLDTKLGDVEVAVLADGQRGGLAEYTKLIGWDVVEQEESPRDSIYVAVMRFEIKVRRPYRDPFTTGDSV